LLSIVTERNEKVERIIERIKSKGLSKGMDSVKHFFDVLDYITFRAFLYVLMVVGAIALIRIAHGRSGV